MNKKIVGIGVLSLLVLTLGLAGYAFAQGQPPQTREYPFISGMMSGYDDQYFGMMGNWYRAGYDDAQNQVVPQDDYPYGPEMMNGFSDYYDEMMGNGYGVMGYGMMGWHGVDHGAMIEVLAESLGLSPEEIETRHDEGESLWEIAEGEGLSDEEIRDLMFSAHDAIMEGAVANGRLNKEQADWMGEHMNQMWDGKYEHCEGEHRNEDGFRWHGMGW